MSVADEFPPDVWIPAAARPRRARLSLVPSAPGVDGVKEIAVWPRSAVVTGREDDYFIRPVLGSDGSVALAPPVRTTVAPVRLTLRGKAVFGALVVVVAGLLLMTAHLSAGSSTSRPAPASVTVRSGDTLWSIATRIAPSVDPRNTVDHLMQVNHLAGVTVRPGQVLGTR